MITSKDEFITRYDNVYFEAIKAMDDYMPPLLNVTVRNYTPADKQAFDTLYENMQKMVEVARRGIRDGEPGHATALQKVIAIGKSIT